jgi:hypothetical protein
VYDQRWQDAKMAIPDEIFQNKPAQTAQLRMDLIQPPPSVEYNSISDMSAHDLMDFGKSIPFPVGNI